MELLIAIVNYNGLALTIDCLRSLEPELRDFPGAQVGLCDNGSDPAEASRLEELVAEFGWHDRISLRRIAPNRGFTGGNNAIIGPALAGNDPPDFVLLLNNDTIVRPGGLKSLVGFMRTCPEVGIAGSRLEDPDGTPQISAFRFINALSEFDRGLQLGLVSRLLGKSLVSQAVPDFATPTDWVPGASMIIRREVFEDIGLLDEAYFTYFDDIDFCFVARQQGWPTWYVPESRIVHLVGKTTGVTDVANNHRRTPSYVFEARRRFLTKNLGPVRALACDVAFIGGRCLHHARCWITGRPNRGPKLALRDHIRQSVLVCGFRPPIVKNPVS